MGEQVIHHAARRRVHEAHQVDRQRVAGGPAQQVGEGDDAALALEHRDRLPHQVIVGKEAQRKSFLAAGLAGQPVVRHRAQLRQDRRHRFRRDDPEAHIFLFQALQGGPQVLEAAAGKRQAGEVMRASSPSLASAMPRSA